MKREYYCRIIAKSIFLLVFFLAFASPVRAANQLPKELLDVLPDGLAETVEKGNILVDGLSWLADSARDTLIGILHGSVRGAAQLALAALICGAAESMAESAGETAARFVPYCGVLCLSALATGDVNTLMGLGAKTVDELETLSKLLLPTLAASMAAGGLVSTASIWQVTTLMVCDLLTNAVQTFLLPITYAYIAVSAAGAVMGESRLDSAADAIKKFAGAGLKAAVMAFTSYLALTGVLTGSADRAAVKATRLVVSGAVPVVGSVLSDATESVLAAASTLRGTLGAVGICAILSVCMIPLLRLFVQFLLYKLAAFVSGLVGTKELSDYLDRLGEAFALVFAMTSSCALVLLVALLVAASISTG